MHAAQQAPGFRRRIRITPTPGSVCSEVEDDYHHMRVTIKHDGSTAHAVKAQLLRAPWTTCPGAVDKCEQTFAGIVLSDFPSRREKAGNCTHLYDLALLGAAHAMDRAVLVYDAYVSDPVDGRRHARIWRNDECVLEWYDKDYRVVAPAGPAGKKLHDLRGWIDTLEPTRQEAARILQWVSLIAHGRIIPMAQQSDASRMPPTCYTFQPERAVIAKRVGKTRDFSDGTAQPLDSHQQTV